jgi:putative ABC transport system permease protein
VLVGAHDPAAVRQRLAGRGLAVLDRAELRSAGLELATRVHGTPLRLMVAVAFLAGTLIVALTAYTAVAERRREYGIVKAMGATGRRLTVLAVAQTFSLAALGLLAGGALFGAGRALIGWVRPQFLVC